MKGICLTETSTSFGSPTDKRGALLIYPDTLTVKKNV
jgi:hypothetical protein